MTQVLLMTAYDSRVRSTQEVRAILLHNNPSVTELSPTNSSSKSLTDEMSRVHLALLHTRCHFFITLQVALLLYNHQHKSLTLVCLTAEISSYTPNLRGQLFISYTELY